jgi:hypothetical protein
MIFGMVVYVTLLGLVFAAFASLVKSESDFERWNEGLDPSVNVVLTLGDEDPGTLDVLRGLWRRFHDSGMLRLPKRRRVPRSSGGLAVPVPNWD